MKVRIPATYEVAVSEVGSVATLLDKNGWKAGLFIATAVRSQESRGRPKSAEVHFTRKGARQFAKDVNAKGWSENVIRRHFAAWEAAADEGLVPHAADLEPGQLIELPSDRSWQEFYPPRWAGDEDAETVAAQAREDGAGESKAVDISQNPKALAAAIKASPTARAAAAAALAGTDEALAIATDVMSVPEDAEIVIGNEKVYESVIEAQASHLRGKRKTITPTTRPEKPEGVTATVGGALTVGILLDDMRRDLNVLTNFVENGNLDADWLDIIREFLTTELILQAQGLLDHPKMTGEDITPEAFGL